MSGRYPFPAYPNGAYGLSATFGVAALVAFVVSRSLSPLPPPAVQAFLVGRR